MTYSSELSKLFVITGGEMSWLRKGNQIILKNICSLYRYYHNFYFHAYDYKAFENNRFSLYVHLRFLHCTQVIFMNDHCFYVKIQIFIKTTIIETLEINNLTNKICLSSIYLPKFPSFSTCTSSNPINCVGTYKLFKTICLLHERHVIIVRILLLLWKSIKIFTVCLRVRYGIDNDIVNSVSVMQGGNHVADNKFNDEVSACCWEEPSEQYSYLK